MCTRKIEQKGGNSPNSEGFQFSPPIPSVSNPFNPWILIHGMIVWSSEKCQKTSTGKGGNATNDVEWWCTPAHLQQESSGQHPHRGRSWIPSPSPQTLMRYGCPWPYGIPLRLLFGLANRRQGQWLPWQLSACKFHKQQLQMQLWHSNPNNIWHSQRL